MIETRISVRNLIEFILRSGDIDNRISGGSDQAVIEGTRIHKMIQKRAGADYRAEVPFSYVYTEDDIAITVEGRADGVIENETGVTIDEIKSTYADVMKFKEAKELHLAQAMFYAYIKASQDNLIDIKVRLTYVNIDTEEIKYFHHTYTLFELEQFTVGVLKQYVKWARFEAEWIEKRTNSIIGLPFPFDYRKGQADLVKQVYYTIHHGKKLYLEAPTGVGKTISTLYPAIQAMGQKLGEKIFYLTAKTITRTVADETVMIMRDRGLKCKSLMLTAKEKICMTGETDCNPDACPYARGHYDRVNDAVFAMLSENDRYTRDTVCEYANRFQVCPFEMQLDLSLFVDVIIGDYNYAFDPTAKLKRFFGEENDTGRFLFLIDETHNLVDRAREMYSALLVKEDLMALKRLTQDEVPGLSKRFEKCNKELLTLKHMCSDYLIDPPIDGFVQAVLKLYGDMENFFEDERKNKNAGKAETSKEVKDAVLEYYFDVGHFLNMLELVDDKYSIYCAYNESGDFYLKLMCVDPSKNLDECMKYARSTILFSATLLPIQYYKKLLAGKDTDYEVYAESVFDPEKRGLIIATDVTSKYTRRTDDEYIKIATYIHETISGKAGNYLAFFPSYSFEEKVFDTYNKLYGNEKNVECILQTSGMNELEREEFLERFKGNTNGDGLFSCIDMDVETEEESTLIGFCVMGGIFSEGIDLKNDSLIGALIVGTGLPLVCLERELMKNKFDENGENGFDYAYKYPGMNKVLQAAGRVIRTENDIGVVVLLDERFLQNQYRKMFPREWENYKLTDIDNINERIASFWDAHL